MAKKKASDRSGLSKSGEKESSKKTMASPKAARSAVTGKFLSSRASSVKSKQTGKPNSSHTTIMTGKGVVPRRVGGGVGYTHSEKVRLSDTTGAGVDRNLGEAFVTRYSGLLDRLVQAAPAESIRDALAAGDDVGGLAALLAEVGPIAPPARDPLAAARARGARAKVALLERAGGGLSAGPVADRLGVTPAAVHARRQRGTLLAVPRANGEFVYPAFQFTEDGTLPGLARVLQAFQVKGPWTRLSVLLSPADVVGGRTPLDALRDGDVDGAVAAVSTYGEHLA